MQQETENRLDAAVRAFKDAPLDPVRAMTAESSILSRWRGPSKTRLTWAVGLSAAAMAGALALGMTLTPSPSVAAELKRIAQNGDAGMRHVVQYNRFANGKVDKVAEFYADGDRARMIMGGQQMIFGRFSSNKAGPERLLNLSANGSATIQDARAGELYKWTEFSASQILKINGAKSKAQVRHGVTLDGQTVDEYDLDTYEVRHVHTVLYADPASERPIKEVVTSSDNLPTLIMEWDYPAYDEALLRGPAIAADRLYDLDRERASIREAMSTAGPVVKTAGEKVELKQLWVDEDGAVAAIVMADFPHPDNFSVKVDGMQIGTEPEDPETTNHCYVHLPDRYQGAPMMVFYAYRHGEPLPKKIGDTASVDIPISHGNVIAGYAHFDGVKVNRCQQVSYLISPMNIPFFADQEKPLKASPTKPAG